MTALPKEFAAVRLMLDREHDVAAPEGDPNDYIGGYIPARDGSGDHHVVVTLLKDMGNNIASAQASHLVRSFPEIESVVMVGIAGGVPNVGRSENHVRLGDVVVSSVEGVIQYDNVKRTMAGDEPRGRRGRPDALLLGKVRLLESDRLLGKRPWEPLLDRGAPFGFGRRPSETADVLHATPPPHEVIAHPYDPGRIANQPKVHYGVIGAANILLKEPNLRDSLSDRFDIRAIEMEGSGIADGAWLLGQDYLIVRGICDYCDAFKNDDWQDYAALAAAAYTRCLLAVVTARGGSAPSEPVQDLSPELARFAKRGSASLSPTIPRVSRSFTREGPLALIRDRIARGGGVVPILGEAGYGKTTILGELYDILESEGSGWTGIVLCRDIEAEDAATVEAFDDAVGRQLADRRSATEVSRQMAKAGRPGVLLVDTLDLILSHRTQSAIRKLFEGIAAEGHVVVFSCRDYEFNLFVDPVAQVWPELCPLQPRYCQVPQFTANEARIAARLFYSEHNPNRRGEDANLFAESLVGAVADDRRLPIIATNPLLLSMACQVYRSDPVPRDLTVAQLYDGYWRVKVTRGRGGVGDEGPGAKPELAQKLAHRSLAGSFKARTLVQELPVTDLARDPQLRDALSSLRSEGVLSDLRVGQSVTFFHQTLLEYAIGLHLATDPEFESALEHLVCSEEKGEFDTFAPAILRQTLAVAPRHLRSEILKKVALERALIFRAAALAVVSVGDEAAVEFLVDEALRHGERHQRLLVDALIDGRDHFAERVWPEWIRLYAGAVSGIRDLISQYTHWLLERMGESRKDRFFEIVETTVAATKEGHAAPPGVVESRLGWFFQSAWRLISDSFTAEERWRAAELFPFLSRFGQQLVIEAFAAPHCSRAERNRFLRLLLTTEIDGKARRQKMEELVQFFTDAVGLDALWPIWSDLLADLPKEPWRTPAVIAAGRAANRDAALMRTAIAETLSSGTEGEAAKYKLLLDAAIDEDGGAAMRQILANAGPESPTETGARLFSLTLAKLAQHSSPEACEPIAVWTSALDSLLDDRNREVLAESLAHRFKPRSFEKVLRDALPITADLRESVERFSDADPEGFDALALPYLAAAQDRLSVAWVTYCRAKRDAGAAQSLLDLARSPSKRTATMAADCLQKLAHLGVRLNEARLLECLDSPLEFVRRLAPDVWGIALAHQGEVSKTAIRKTVQKLLNTSNSNCCQSTLFLLRRALETGAESLTTVHGWMSGFVPTCLAERIADAGIFNRVVAIDALLLAHGDAAVRAEVCERCHTLFEWAALTGMNLDKRRFRELMQAASVACPSLIPDLFDRCDATRVPLPLPHEVAEPLVQCAASHSQRTALLDRASHASWSPERVQALALSLR